MNHLNPLNPQLVSKQQADAMEVNTAREGLEAINELKNCRKGYPYLQSRLADKAEDFHRTAIEGKTPEDREIARVIYLKFKQEILPMIDIDENNHRNTLGA